jgi:hypothetical protein
VHNALGVTRRCHIDRIAADRLPLRLDARIAVIWRQLVARATHHGEHGNADGVMRALGRRKLVRNAAADARLGDPLIDLNASRGSHATRNCTATPGCCARRRSATTNNCRAPARFGVPSAPVPSMNNDVPIRVARSRATVRSASPVRNQRATPASTSARAAAPRVSHSRSGAPSAGSRRAYANCARNNHTAPLQLGVDRGRVERQIARRLRAAPRRQRARADASRQQLIAGGDVHQLAHKWLLARRLGGRQHARVALSALVQRVGGQTDADETSTSTSTPQP